MTLKGFKTADQLMPDGSPSIELITLKEILLTLQDIKKILEIRDVKDIYPVGPYMKKR